MSIKDFIFGWSFKKDPEEDQIKAPVVQPENDDAAFVVGANYYGYHKYMLNMEQNFNNDADLILKYREISLHPEVDAAITDIVNEAVGGSDSSNAVEIDTDALEDELSDKVRNIIKQEFDTLLGLLNFNNKSYEIFRKWYVDGRIAYLKIIDTENTEEGITELRYIPSINIKKIREEKYETFNGVDILKGFNEYFIYSRSIVDSNNKKVTASPTPFGVKITADSVAYCHSGLYDEKENQIYSYLQVALKPTNQLRMIEDALIMYTLARAPQRRLFYIDVGNLSKNKAEEYMQSIIRKYRNKMVYDAVTGQVKDNSNVMSMMEDIWLPRMNGQQGTEVSTLDGAIINSGQLDLMDYFKKKLYQSLRVPLSRITGDSAQGFTIGRPSEITREEIKFSKFIERLQTDFEFLFLDLLKTQLILKKIVTSQEWNEIKGKLDFKWNTDSHFRELKDADLLKERLAMLEMIEPFLGQFFSFQYARKNILQMTDEQIEQMQSEIEEEQEEMQNYLQLKNPEMAQNDQEQNPQANGFNQDKPQSPDDEPQDDDYYDMPETSDEDDGKKK